MSTTRTCEITESHCENCGSTDYEDVNLGDQGYSACCNELVVSPHRDMTGKVVTDCRGHHLHD